jgi:hypothetical protein
MEAMSMSHADNLRAIERYCREHFCIGSVELSQLERAAEELDRLTSTSLPCDSWDSRCAQLTRQLAEAKAHPAIDDHPRLIAALKRIAEQDGVQRPRFENPSDVAKRALGLPTSGDEKHG